MNYLILDTESTGAISSKQFENYRPSKGSALDPRNHLCYVGYGNDSNFVTIPIEYEVGIPFASALRDIQVAIDSSTVVVLFNAKHDLHWLRRYGIKFQHRNIWDCQLAEFIINGQETPFPSLDTVSIKYGGTGKLDMVKQEYWAKGIDTDLVPKEILTEYLNQDLISTEQVFLGQVEYLKDKPLLKRLIWLNCQDEIITEEMEWNGLHFDIPGLLKHAEKLETEIIATDQELHALFPYPQMNWASPLQVSAVLYGGTIEYKEKEEYLFTYKNSKKPPTNKSRWITKKIECPRLAEPLPRSETSTPGVFSTDNKILRQLKIHGPSKRILDLLLARRDAQTQIKRYFRGIPDKYTEMGWRDGIIHGQLHHVVAATGRMSSSNPNQQNIDERARTCLKTRFKILHS